MTSLPLVLAALAVLPSDRMAMADRLFDRGAYAEARSEYRALKGAEGIAADELLYRLAECARLCGDGPAARKAYSDLLEAHPLSRHAARARLMRALSGTDDEKRAELKLLDADAVPAPVRAAALYHYGVLADDKSALARSAKLDPKGPYALYAKFRHASLVADDPDPAVRRTAVDELFEIHRRATGDLSREALYFAATKCYSDKRYGESSLLFRKYLRLYPDDARAANARTMAAWSDYLAGKYADAASLCGEGKTDDAAYLLAACAYATLDRARARELMEKYLADWPQGRYRRNVELPLARMAFDDAVASGDAARTAEAAKRALSISGAPQDRMRLAWALEKGGMAAEAASVYRQVAQDSPGTDEAAEALYRKAMIDIRESKWSAAELSLAEALATGRNPSRRAESLYWRGVAMTRLGHEAEGAKCLKEALAAGVTVDQAREARLLLADEDFRNSRTAEAKAAYAALVAEGACDRMGAAKVRAVGRFLLESSEGKDDAEAAKTCARALAARADAPEWRQAAYALLGEAQERAGEFESAIASYRQCLAEDVRTDDARLPALRLGVLLSKAGEFSEAEKFLREAVALNSADGTRRAEAYLWLAKNCEANDDARGACAYATVVTTLFSADPRADEARKILEAHPEEAQ